VFWACAVACPWWATQKANGSSTIRTGGPAIHAHVDRRRFLRVTGCRLLTLALASFLYQRGWADDQGVEELDAWFAEYLRLGRDLGSAEISQEAWQDGIDGLFRSQKPANLLKRINFDAVNRQLMHGHIPIIGPASLIKEAGARESQKPTTG